MRELAYKDLHDLLVWWEKRKHVAVCRGASDVCARAVAKRVPMFSLTDIHSFNLSVHALYRCTFSENALFFY